MSAHQTCQHKDYHLTCEEYDGMLESTGDCCQICGIPGHRTRLRKLHIDHDPSLGRWAVRGLLCAPCNVRLGRGGSTPGLEPAVAAYLAHPYRGAEGAERFQIAPARSFTVRFSDEQHEWMRRQAYERRVSMQKIIEEGIDLLRHTPEWAETMGERED